MNTEIFDMLIENLPELTEEKMEAMLQLKENMNNEYETLKNKIQEQNENLNNLLTQNQDLMNKYKSLALKINENGTPENTKVEETLNNSIDEFNGFMNRFNPKKYTFSLNNE